MTRSATPALLSLLVLVTGCSSTDGPPELPEITEVKVQLSARDDLNPNDLGEPTPVDIRIYQLTADTQFTRASFDELWTEDKQALGTSLAAPPQIVSIVPGAGQEQPVTHWVKLAPRVEYIGLMALFQGQPEEGLEARKVCLPVRQVSGKVFDLTGHTIVVVVAKPGAAPKPTAADDAQPDRDEAPAPDEPAEQG